MSFSLSCGCSAHARCSALQGNSDLVTHIEEELKQVQLLQQDRVSRPHFGNDNEPLFWGQPVVRRNGKVLLIYWLWF